MAQALLSNPGCVSGPGVALSVNQKGVSNILKHTSRTLKHAFTQPVQRGHRALPAQTQGLTSRTSSRAQPLIGTQRETTTRIRPIVTDKETGEIQTLHMTNERSTRYT